MRQVTVNKNDLLNTIKANRETHRGHFEEAIDAWKNWAEKMLEKAVEDAKAGRNSEAWFSLVRKVVFNPKPEDHTRDYDDVIGMLEMHVDDTVTLEVKEYQQYVNDDWQWKANFTDTYNSYVVG